MKRALERHDAGDALVVPIILRPVDWKQAPFSRLQALPKDGKPISQWRPKDKAYNDLTVSLRGLISSRTATPAVGSEIAKNDPPVATRTVAETMGIELTIDRDFEEYSDADQRKLLEAIKNLIDVDGELRVVSRKRGSVKLRLEMTPAQAERLYWAVKQGKLQQFDVIDAKRDEEAIRVYESIGENEWDSQVSGFDRSIAVSKIIEDMLSTDNARRCRAIAGLAANASHIEDGADLLIPLFQDEDFRIRALASRALGRIASHDKSVIPRLIDQLLAADVDIQAVALRSLIDAGHAAEPARGLLEHLLAQSNDTYIRIMSAQALMRIGVFSGQQISRLAEALSDAAPDVASAARRAIQDFRRLCVDQSLTTQLDDAIRSGELDVDSGS